MKKIYFDTNIYNFIAKNYSLQEYKMILDKFQVLLSPVNIWEVLLCSDELARERIVFSMQHICCENLLAEPEELIIDYIEKKLKFRGLQIHSKDDYFCKSELQKIWSDVRRNRNKTFVTNEETIARINIFKYWDRFMQSCLRRDKSFDYLFNKIDIYEFFRYDDFNGVATLKEIIKKIDKLPRISYMTKNLLKDCVFWTIFGFFVGFTIHQDPIRKYWDDLKITELSEKLKHFSSEEFKQFIDKGPFALMGALYVYQLRHSLSRGNVFDRYHILYVDKVDIFVTSDTRLKEFKNFCDNEGIFEGTKVLEKIEDVNFIKDLMYDTTKEMIWQPYKGFIEKFFYNMPKELQRLDLQIERYAESDLAFPYNLDELKKLNNCAIVIISGVTSDPSEIPFNRVYIRNRYGETNLKLLRRYNVPVDDEEVRKKIGEYRMDHVYLVPMYLLSEEGEIMIDWSRNRNDFGLTRIEGKIPEVFEKQKPFRKPAESYKIESSFLEQFLKREFYIPRIFEYEE